MTVEDAALLAIARLVGGLGWCILVPPEAKDGEAVDGMIVGTLDYCEAIRAQLDDGERWRLLCSPAVN